MVAIQRLRSVWTGWSGAPGVSTFYATDASLMLNDLLAFWNAIKPRLPVGVTVQTENFGDTIDDESGTLLGGWTGGTTAAAVGTGSGTYSQPTGAHISWVSDGIPYGYRVKGRTFIVPMASVSFQSDGTINDTDKASMVTASTALITAQTGNFKIWNRPRAARAADGSRPAVTARDGSSWDVISATVPDRCSVLRSRRN